MVAMTKRCLRKFSGRSQADEEELQTLLVGIEAALNSRPIIQDDDNETLSPTHFLTGEKLTTNPRGPEPVRTESLSRFFLKHQRPT